MKQTQFYHYLSTMFRLLTWVLVVLGATTAQAQFMGFDRIDESHISPWESSEIGDYAQVYHFGDSEMESSLAVIHTDGKWYAQLSYGEFSETAEEWMRVFVNFTNVRVEGNKFYSDQTNGEFVHYTRKEKLECLKVDVPWSGLGEEGQYEVGWATHKLEKRYSGKYNFTSYRLLTADDLAGLSKKELQIMRNEIFARYGHIFRPGGKMDAYFKKQDWYHGQYQNVDDFISDLEKKNIELIRKFEQQ